jgi:hypothetical protein
MALIDKIIEALLEWIKIRPKPLLAFFEQAEKTRKDNLELVKYRYNNFMNPETNYIRQERRKESPGIGYIT